MPQELVDFNAKKHSIKPPQVSKIDKIDESTPSEAPKSEISKSEKISEFKKMLSDAKVASDWDWARAFKIICYDKRYKLIDSMNDKKKIFNEFIQEKRDQEFQERKTKSKKLKSDFFDMLSKIPNMNVRSSYKKILPLISSDPRYKAIEKDVERLDFFDDFIFDMNDKEKKKLDEETQERKKTLRRLMEQRYIVGEVDSTTLWRRFRENLKGMEAFEQLDELARMQVWDDFIRDVTVREEDKKIKERTRKIKRDRRERQAFWNLLLSHQKLGNVTLQTRWKDFKPLIKDTLEYKALAEQTQGATAHDIFEDLLDDLDAASRRNKQIIKDIIKKHDYVLTPETEYSDFYTFVTGQNDALTQEDIKMFYQDVHFKKDKRDQFMDVLEKMDLNMDSTWNDVKSRVTFDALEENEKKDLFDKYISKLTKKRKREDNPVAETQQDSKKIHKEEEVDDIAKRREALLMQFMK